MKFTYKSLNVTKYTLAKFQMSTVKQRILSHSHTQKHYENLAESYDEKLNIYCQERFLSLIKKFEYGKILDVGCGTGYIQSRLNKDAVGLDLTHELLKRNNGKSVCANAEKLPFKSKTFDLVFSINLIEHVKNHYKLIMECKRVLKKNGILIIVTPNGDMEFILDIAEKFNLKLPEGPHKFLNFKEMKRLVKMNRLDIISSQRFIIFPKKIAGITEIFESIEGLIPFFCLFQYVVGRKS